MRPHPNSRSSEVPGGNHSTRSHAVNLSVQVDTRLISCYSLLLTMRIAITGGSCVIELALSQGHSVVSIDCVPPAQDAAQPGVTFVQAEITDYRAFEQALHGCDALVHLAAIPTPWGHPDYVVHNNNVVG